MVFGIADCPVCADSGALIALKPRRPGAGLVFFCPLCGCAFREPTPPRTLDQILSVEQVAPEGVVLPSDDEVVSSGLDLVKLPGHWLEWLTIRDPRMPERPPVLGTPVA